MKSSGLKVFAIWSLDGSRKCTGWTPFLTLVSDIICHVSIHLKGSEYQFLLKFAKAKGRTSGTLQCQMPKNPYELVILIKRDKMPVLGKVTLGEGGHFSSRHSPPLALITTLELLTGHFSLLYSCAHTLLLRIREGVAREWVELHPGWELIKEEQWVYLETIKRVFSDKELRGRLGHCCLALMVKQIGEHDVCNCKSSRLNSSSTLSWVATSSYNMNPFSLLEDGHTNG